MVTNIEDNRFLTDLTDFKKDSLEELWESFEDEFDTATKLYYKLEAIVKRLHQDSTCHSSPQCAIVTSTTTTNVTTNGTTEVNTLERHRHAFEVQLEDLLNWDAHSVDIQRADLLAAAIKHVQESQQKLHGKRKPERRAIGMVSQETKTKARDDMPKARVSREGALESSVNAACIIIQALCRVDPEMAFIKHNDDAPAFHTAAQEGLAELVKIMVFELERFANAKRKNAIAMELLSREYNGSTALRKAAKSLHLKVLGSLLDKFPGLADMPSLASTIEEAGSTKGGKPNDIALEAFKILAKAKGILEEQDTPDDVEIWKRAVKAGSTAILSLLLQSKSRQKFSSRYSNAEFVVENGSVEMWELFDREHQKDFLSKPECDFLHKAVHNRNAKLVDAILKVFPAQAEVNRGTIEKPDYPLQRLLAKDQSKDNTFKAIRDELLCAMICSRKLGIQDIRKILADSNVDGNHMCLHLATVDTSERTFADYAQFLIDQNSGERTIFRFEKVLKYVRFPSLKGPPSNGELVQIEDRRIDHTEVRDIFKWLEQLKVDKVMEISVPDRLYNPHSDEVVAECVNGRAVRVLKWKKLDLYLGNLYKEGEENLEELDLYSSGNQSVHEQWYRELERFKNLRRLSVFVVEDVLSQARVKNALQELERGLSGIKTFLEERQAKEENTRKPFSLTSCAWDGNATLIRPTNLEDIAIKTSWPRLDGFVKAFTEYSMLNTDLKRTKVALIDSGVVVYGGLGKINASDSSIMSTNLAHRIVDGVSLVNNDDTEQPYWHASEPHGTQMAKLICSINPFCDLYIIKVTETRASGVPANVVASAIEWARRKKVDVISLSLVVHQDRAELQNQMHRAKDEDIVIVSSTPDGGVRRDETATSASKPMHNDVITIAASDWNGNVLDKSQKMGYSYCVVGENVPVGLVPFLRSRECVSGSSVATALAAGLASLILACCRISKRCQTGENAPNWRGRKVAEIMEAMSVTVVQSAPKWIDLDNFCGQAKQLAGDYDFETFVDENFVFDF